MSEAVLYQDQFTTVTSTRFMVGAQMYPIRGITAVSSNERHYPPQRGMAIFVGLLGGLFLLAALIVLIAPAPAAASASGDSPSPVGSFICTGLFGAMMLAWGMREYRKQQWRHEYTVQIFTGGMQHNALVVSDKAQHDAILSALHRAIAG